MKKKTAFFFGQFKIKICFIVIASIASTSIAFAQSNNGDNVKMMDAPGWHCGQIEHDNYLRTQDPDFDKKRAEMEKTTQEFIAKHPTGKINSASAVITIPVVVHIVWNTASENISDAAVNTLINLLNQDYGRTNADTSQTPAVWKPIAANMGIQFCLALRDPNNNPTTGIIRRQTTITSFTTDDKVKFTAQGGSDAWNTTKYFNIWICDLAGSPGGYAEMPTSVQSNTFGNVTDYVFYNTYVVSHECGHSFNLLHIWGDDGTACTGSDGVSDTPNQAGPSGCPTYPALDACATAAPGYMFMNYMDYGPTPCPKNLFTNGQSARANAVLNTPPYNALTTSLGCIPPNLVANDAETKAVINPNGLTCGLTFIPNVTIRNWGNNNLTSCIINYQVDADPVQTYNWSGNLASLATENVMLSAMTTTAGTHTFTCYTSQPNATTDGNPANDKLVIPFNLIPAGQALPLAEGLEAATFPPSGWTLENPDALKTWERTTAAAKTGTASMLFNSVQYSCTGCIDILHTPNIDLTSVTSPQVTFQVAYRLKSNPALPPPNWSDSLSVDISTDCGKTWTNLYYKYSTALTTISPPFSTTAFVPTPNDWRLETINLAAYAANNNVLLRWKASSDYENNLYVDDINITGAVATNEYSLDRYVSVFPNPSSGILNVDVSVMQLGYINIKIYNVLGTVISEMPGVISAPQKFKFDLSEQPRGIYFIEVKSEKGKSIKKFVLNK